MAQDQFLPLPFQFLRCVAAPTGKQERPRVALARQDQISIVAHVSSRAKTRLVSYSSGANTFSLSLKYPWTGERGAKRATSLARTEGGTAGAAPDNQVRRSHRRPPRVGEVGCVWTTRPPSGARRIDIEQDRSASAPSSSRSSESSLRTCRRRRRSRKPRRSPRRPGSRWRPV